MATAVVPASITLLDICSTLFDREHQVLKPSSADFKTLQHCISDSTPLNEQSTFNSSPALITTLQASMLAALSMYGGVLVPMVKQVTSNDEGIRLTWDSGIVDTFTFGVIDDAFQQFFSSFQDRLSSKPQFSKQISSSIFRGLQQFIDSYIIVLDALCERIDLLLKDTHTIKTVLKGKSQQDLLFIIISSLPTEQISALFMFIQQFFPDDLTVKSQDGNTISVCSYFQSPSVDPRLLIEKTRVYMDLYFLSKQPIIQHITQTKTTEYLTELLRNTNTKLTTLNALQNLKKYQIDSRLTLYRLLSQFYAKLLS